MEATGVEPRTRSGRLVAGSALLWASLAVGVLTNLVEGYFAVGGLVEMARGSCSAALIGLWVGLPLVPIGVLLFVVGLVLARREDPKALKAGAVGLALSLVALPFWYVLAGVIAQAFALG
jgi:hypothetical protein